MCSLRKRLDQRTFGRKVASITPALLQHVVEGLSQQGPAGQAVGMRQLGAMKAGLDHEELISTTLSGA